MADTTTTLTQITSAVDAWYTPTLLVRAVSNFVYTMYGQIRDLPRNAGENVRFRRYGNLAVATTALTEGVTPAGSQLSKTDINAAPLQYGDYVTLTDKLVFTTLDPIMVETSEIQGDQASDTLDQITRDILVAVTTEQFASTATQESDITNAMVLNTSEIREGVLTLQEAKARSITSMIDPSDAYNTVPVGKCYVGIIHPRALRDLKGNTAFIPVKNYPSNVDLMPHEVGALDEVRFIMTQNAKVAADGNGGGNVYRTIVFGQNFYGITRISGESLRNIVKPLGSAGTADPLDQRSTMGWKATFVAKILNDAFGLVIYHGATQ